MAVGDQCVVIVMNRTCILVYVLSALLSGLFFWLNAWRNAGMERRCWGGVWPTCLWQRLTRDTSVVTLLRSEWLYRSAQDRVVNSYWSIPVGVAAVTQWPTVIMLNGISWSEQSSYLRVYVCCVKRCTVYKAFMYLLQSLSWLVAGLSKITQNVMDKFYWHFWKG